MNAELFTIARWKVVKIKVPDDVARRRDELHEKGLCISCERPLPAGGLDRCGQCNTCYCGSLAAVRRGDISREELIRTGKQYPPGRGGRKPSNPFTKQLAERRS